MSALPVPRGPAARPATHPRPPAAESPVRRAARDPALSHMDVRLLVWLDEWFEHRPGIYPTKAQAAAELHVSVDTIARSLGRAAAAGYVSRPLGAGRPGPWIDFDLVPPRIGIGREPSGDVQGDLFRQAEPQPCGLRPRRPPQTPLY